MIRDPSFRSVRTMIKTPPDYQGASFRIKPTPTSGSPPAPASPSEKLSNTWSSSRSIRSDTEMTKSTRGLFRSEDSDGRRSPANSTDQFAALVQQHDSEIAVVSKPNWSGKEGYTNLSMSAKSAIDDELNMSRTDSLNAPFIRDTSQLSPVRLLRLMSRTDLLNPDQQENNHATSEKSVDIHHSFSSPRRHNMMMSPSSSSLSFSNRSPSRSSLTPYAPYSHSNRSPSYRSTSPTRHGLNPDMIGKGDLPHQDPLS